MSALLLVVVLLAAAPPAGDSDAPGVSAAVFEAMIARLADEARAEAEAAVERGALLAAVSALDEVVRWRPEDAGAWHRLGQILTQLGHLDRAWQALRAAQRLEPERERLLADLLAVAGQRPTTPSELRELAAALGEARERLGHQPWILRGQARLAARQRQWGEAESAYRELLAVAPLDDELRLELGDLARDAGRVDEATRRYREIDATGPLGAMARERLWQLEVDAEARRFGWTGSGAVISAPARAALEAGQALLAAGRLAEAEERLRAALAHSPQAAEARLWLGEVHRGRGQRAAAELEYLRALALEPGMARAHARLGELYLEEPGAQPVTAVVLLNRALLLRPDWAELHLHLAKAHRLVGELPQARQALETYLASGPSDEGRAEALALRAALGALFAPPGGSGPTSADAPAGESLAGLSRVSALLARGETDAAMAELRRAGAGDAPGSALEGRILHAAGRLPEAADAFRRSLGLRPDQAGIHEQLGVVLLELGQRVEAGEHFARAAALGDADAQFQLAQLALHELTASWWTSARRAPELWAVRAALGAYLAGGEVTYAAAAGTALREVDRRLVRLGVVVALAVAALALLGGLAAWRRWGGATLSALVTRNPELSPDVQEVLAAIRHEVLKHQTMALQGIVAAGPRPTASGRQALAALLPPAAGPWPLADRLAGYLAQLELIGARAGLRLNLRRRDPTVAPILAAFQTLAGLAPAVRVAGDGELPPALMARLAAVSERLNVRAFAALERLVHALGTGRLDAALLEQVFASVRREGGFAGATIAPLVLELEAELPAVVVMPRAALVDVLANLMRNALQAEAAAGLTPLCLAVRVADRVDEVTGLERLEIGVVDQAPGLLDAAALADPARGHGLGLVRAHLERCAGRLRVEPVAAPWTKAVIVTLARDSGEAAS